MEGSDRLHIYYGFLYICPVDDWATMDGYILFSSSMCRYMFMPMTCGVSVSLNELLYILGWCRLSIVI